jgi:isopentenyl-diphosphate Delta-isomerase
MAEEIILVDENDSETGAGEKMRVHEEGLLHRAFSVMIFNSYGEVLLQKRAKAKYHSGGLWTNACCSHPRVGKDIIDEAKKRLKEEMGIEAELEEKFSFMYRAELENGLTENELDHVLDGRFDGEPQLNSEEAEDWRWVDIMTLKEDIKKHPESYTPWLPYIVERY